METSSSISVVSSESLMISKKNSSHAASTDTFKEDAVVNHNDSVKDTFYRKLIEYDENHTGSSRRPWTRDRIAEVIADLKNIKVAMKKKTVDYYWISKYDVVTTETDEYLTFKKRYPVEPKIRIVPREQYFDILTEVHTSCRHGGRDKMLLDIKGKYYIPKKAVEIYVSVCPVCESRRHGHKNETVPRSIASRHFNERGWFDLIDCRSCPDGEYNWLLNYQNLDAKFTILRPLKAVSTAEVAYELLTIFLTLGAPHSLQSDLGHEFITNVLEELAVLWSDCKIVQESQDHTEKNSSAEIESMLQSWMNENNSTTWSTGCLFVQYYKNSSFNRAEGKIPFEAIFGGVSKASINTTYVPGPSLLTESGEESSQQEHLTIHIKHEVETEDYPSNPETFDTESENNTEEKFTPPVHENESTAHKCKICNSNVHMICGVIEDDLRQQLQVSCYVCKSEQNIVLVKRKGLKRAAEEVNDNTPNKLAPFDLGRSVLVTVPEKFRGPHNTKTIKGKIVDFRNGVYRVATNIVTLKNWFSRHDLQYCETDCGDVLETSVSLEVAVARQAVSDGQASQKCTCKPAVDQCHTKRCICFKNKGLCGPKCHQSLACINT